MSGFISKIIATLAVIGAIAVIVAFPSSPLNANFLNIVDEHFPAIAVEQPQTDIEYAYEVLHNAGGTDVEIIIADDSRNCALWEEGPFGVLTKVESAIEGYEPQGGCWRSNTPDVFYISSAFRTNDSLRTVVLHEYAHVLQHRGEAPTHAEGLEGHEHALECMADVQAHEFGAPSRTLGYFDTGICEDYRHLINEDDAKAISFSKIFDRE